ncbi:MAG: N-acetyltransferase [Chloroflexi bacterium]|nr:N-acetyltransferase [Chloroflexota bacterium]
MIAPVIRPETPADEEAIRNVTMLAFAGRPYSDGTEHLIIERLRDAGALSLSLVAEMNGKIAGHVTFSVVMIDGRDQGWHGLGPISVLPEFQKQGIGSALIHDGLARIHAMGAKGCALEGSPVYYRRFGFMSYPQLFYEGAPAPEYFMAFPFYEDVPAGKAEFHKAFYGVP